MIIIYFQQFLDQISLLNQHYLRISEITGENFNVFTILKLQSSEVRLHSAFLAELLNPKGNHGQKDTFLKIFADKFQFRNNGFDTSGATVDIERHSGFIKNEGTEGGRLDIIITDMNHNQIIIENKIYAGDQNSQLLRYSNYSKKADLLYLTLDGKQPSDESRRGLISDEDFKCLSYKINITDWLELCRKEVAIYPIIRETLTQYLNLIKFLTNQTMNESMSKELATLIASNNRNVEAAFTIINNLESIKKELLVKFETDLVKVAIELGLKVTNKFNLKERYSGVYFYKSGWELASIAFGFQSYSNILLYGVLVEKPDEFPAELREELVNAKPSDSKTSEWWPIHRLFESPFNNWSDSKEVWTAVADGSMAIQFKLRLQEMLNITESNNILL